MFISATQKINECERLELTPISFKSSKKGFIMESIYADATSVRHIGCLYGKDNYMMAPDPIVETKFVPKPKIALNKQPIMKASLESLYGTTDVKQKKVKRNLKTVIYEEYVETFRVGVKELANFSTLSTSQFVKKYRSEISTDLLEYSAYIKTGEFIIKFDLQTQTPHDGNVDDIAQIFL